MEKHFSTVFFLSYKYISISITMFTLHTYILARLALMAVLRWSGIHDNEKVCPIFEVIVFLLSNWLTVYSICNAYVFSRKFNFASHSIRVVFAERSTFRIECDVLPRMCHSMLSRICFYSFRILALHFVWFTHTYKQTNTYVFSF